MSVLHFVAPSIYEAPPAHAITADLRASHTVTVRRVTCPGGLITHAHGTVAGCTEDEDEDGCRGRELRHEGDPVPCIVWTPSGCNYCGVH